MDYEPLLGIVVFGVLLAIAVLGYMASARAAGRNYRSAVPPETPTDTTRLR